MTVVVNGEERELREDATIVDAIVAAGASAERRGIAVAVDGEVVPRSEWETTLVRDGQSIEVVQAVQGG